MAVLCQKSESVTEPIIHDQLKPSALFQLSFEVERNSKNCEHHLVLPTN